mmetsp:Transcript_43684/g.139186  ORF Transcript_43684/g.139186 Transcript_43684/m.139186 type:complete len:177 (+) Transcript_43684:249-779(+)
MSRRLLKDLSPGVDLEANGIPHKKMRVTPTILLPMVPATTGFGVWRGCATAPVMEVAMLQQSATFASDNLCKAVSLAADVLQLPNSFNATLGAGCRRTRPLLQTSGKPLNDMDPAGAGQHVAELLYAEAKDCLVEYLLLLALPEPTQIAREHARLRPTLAVGVLAAEFRELVRVLS